MTQSTIRAAMPGAFNFEHHHDPGSASRLSGAKAHIFQPPRTPSTSAASSLYLTRSTTSILSENVERLPAGARKRTRIDYNEENNTAMMEDWSVGGCAADIEDPGSPMPFVNTRYRLAGGMDTPTYTAAAAHDIDASEYSEVGYRRELSSIGVTSQFGEQNHCYFPSTLNPISTDSNGRSRVPSLRSHHSDGWSRTALGVVGEVVGKVWEFCKTSAFKGFYAGGGKGYKVDTSYSTMQAGDSFRNQELEKSFSFTERETTPLPGKFPEDDFIPDYMDTATPEGTPPRAAKRRQVSANRDEIAKNWVVVPPSTATPTKTQPRGPARYSMPTASSASRRGTAARPTSRPSAVAQVTRRPMLASRGSHAGSPSLQSNRGASFASPRSPAGKVRGGSMQGTRGTPNSTIRAPESPAAVEAQRWAALKKKEEREADESIRRLDAQLKAMIREGKEALGTKVEVDIDDEVESGNFGSKKWAI